MRTVEVYTDGSWKAVKSAGGWAALLQCETHHKTIFGGVMNTTINRMELLAVIQALSILTEPCKVVIYSDSTYVVKGINDWMDNWEMNNWRTSTGPVKNQDLWEQLSILKDYHNVKMVWVRGHNGDANNELVDRLATTAADNIYLESQK